MASECTTRTALLHYVQKLYTRHDPGNWQGMNDLLEKEWLPIAQGFYRFGDYELAQSYLTEYLARFNFDHEGHKLLAKTYRAQGRLREAVFVLEQSVGLYDRGLPTTVRYQLVRYYTQLVINSAQTPGEIRRYYARGLHHWEGLPVEDDRRKKYAERLLQAVLDSRPEFDIHDNVLLGTCLNRRARGKPKFLRYLLDTHRYRCFVESIHDQVKWRGGSLAWIHMVFKMHNDHILPQLDDTRRDQKVWTPAFLLQYYSDLLLLANYRVRLAFAAFSKSTTAVNDASLTQCLEWYRTAVQHYWVSDLDSKLTETWSVHRQEHQAWYRVFLILQDIVRTHPTVWWCIVQFHPLESASSAKITTWIHQLLPYAPSFSDQTSLRHTVKLTSGLQRIRWLLVVRLVLNLQQLIDSNDISRDTHSDLANNNYPVVQLTKHAQQYTAWFKVTPAKLTSAIRRWVDLVAEDVTNLTLPWFARLVWGWEEGDKYRHTIIQRVLPALNLNTPSSEPPDFPHLRDIITAVLDHFAGQAVIEQKHDGTNPLELEALCIDFWNACLAWYGPLASEDRSSNHSAHQLLVHISKQLFPLIARRTD
ncbi:hypothetical protein IWQ62_000117 [Dispira parvispora]|uniref:Uncharacterized protein n=1 Tax=Dispira parvispora TaxID=1520584 RepID=A0A9W8AWK8_9FUNG|nr:hypothetical protein IWQ62_000117 [Dispira parvispora]